MKIKKEFIASIDVDAQKGFTPLCPKELPVPKGDEIVDELNAQAKYAAFRVGSKDAHPFNPVWLADENHGVASPIHPDIGGKNTDLYWPAHCVVGTRGFELLDGLPQPEAYDYFVWKGMERHMHPYGACFHDLGDTRSTGLIEFLDGVGVKTVIVGGLATDYCVVTTVSQLLGHGFQVILNLGACRAINDSAVPSIIKEIESRFNSPKVGERFRAINSHKELENLIEGK